MRWMTGAVCAVATLLAGCQSMPSADARVAFGTDWQLERVDGDAVTVVQTMVLTDDGAGALSIGGFAGCNRYGGKASLDREGLLTVGALASTRKACSDKSVMEAEAAFLQVLGNARFNLDSADRQLTLRGVQHTLSFREGAG